MIFPVLELESVVQVNDKTRLDARKTYVTAGEAAVTLTEIDPGDGSGFVDVTATQYLDYQYATEGDKTIQLRVTTDGAPELLTKTLSILSAADDKLFSTDAELLPYENDILSYVRSGRNSFLDVHRAAQDRIVTWLDEHRIWDTQGNRLTKDNIIDIEEVNDWSKFMTLRLIFEQLSNSVDDIFSVKSSKYKAMEVEARNRASLRLDRDNDGEQDVSKTENRSTFMVRR